MILNIILSIISSYLIGSISPAYLIARIFKGIDVREYGDGNAGTVNVGSVVGIWAAVITAIFDVSKGVISIFIAFYLFSLPQFLIFIPVYFTIIGHIFPFYLKFRGGQGAATTAGVLVFYIIKMLYEGVLSPFTMIAVLGVIILSVLATGDSEAVGLITTSFMGYAIVMDTGISTVSILLLSLSIFLFFLVLRNSIKKKLFTVKKKLDVKIWRIVLRPFAFLFIPIDIYGGRRILLFVVGGLVIIFLVVDIVRMFLKISVYQIFKKKEFRKFSSMTGFLIAVFLMFLLFSSDIAYLSLSFLIAGDLYGKLVGIKFGKRKIIKNRTLEGSLGFLTGSFIAGYVVCSIFNVNIVLLIAGAIFASLVELLSTNFDDNFTVGILTPGFLYSIKYFFGM